MAEKFIVGGERDYHFLEEEHYLGGANQYRIIIHYDEYESSSPLQNATTTMTDFHSSPWSPQVTGLKQLGHGMEQAQSSILDVSNLQLDSQGDAESRSDQGYKSNSSSYTDRPHSQEIRQLKGLDETTCTGQSLSFPEQGISSGWPHSIERSSISSNAPINLGRIDTEECSNYTTSQQTMDHIREPDWEEQEATERDDSTSSPPNPRTIHDHQGTRSYPPLQDWQMQLFLRSQQQNMKRLMASKRKQEARIANQFTPLPPKLDASHHGHGTPPCSTPNALTDWQMQLMLLELQNKKRLKAIRLEPLKQENEQHFDI